MQEGRRYPHLEPTTDHPDRPISFVTVRFSDEYEHNIVLSDCVRSPRNELITVDNRGNLFFPCLGRAINFGLAQAQHEIIVVVHEDVLLPEHWEQHLLRCIDALDEAGFSWGLLGCAGWPAPARKAGMPGLIGHWSDPHGYFDTLANKLFAEVPRIDEHLMVLRRSQGVRLDADLPSIHNIGRDLPRTLARSGLQTFVINAPTIHKYADVDGKPVQQASDSAKIKDRKSFAYRADKSLSDEYLLRKWSLNNESPGDAEGTVEDGAQLGPPVILIGKGGGGSRLLSLLGRDLGLFLGNKVTASGDTIELAVPTYRGVLRKYLELLEHDRKRTPAELKAAATTMVQQGGSPALWGFKLPESIFLVPELMEAFPDARFIHLIRDPLTTCLRRTHMTARLDNQIGRVTLPAAYGYFGLPAARILEDDPSLHMAYTTRHQLEIALDTLPSDRCLEVRFEHLIADPIGCLKDSARWLKTPVAGSLLASAVDPSRAGTSYESFSPALVGRLQELLLPIRSRLGYGDGAVEG